MPWPLMSECLSRPNMNEKDPNKVVQHVDAYDPEHDPVLEFQDKVLSCLSDIGMYNSHIMKNSEALDRRVQDFRALIHGEDI
jgi:hypothetical protein